ncbi:hypothetical protein I3843_14G076100 [Carya illinoinensis]|nr:hypothetical protein I3843_14G076100 [Carya illinoinensis]
MAIEASTTTDPVGDIEAGVGLPAVGLGVELLERSRRRRRRHNMNWAKIIIPSCLTGAIDVTLVYIQVHSDFPTSFHFLNMAMLLAFASFFVGWFINPEYMVTTKIFVNCGAFFTYTAFFIGVTTPVPSSLKIIGWLIYAISLIAVSLSFKTEIKENYDQARRLISAYFRN